MSEIRASIFRAMCVLLNFVLKFELFPQKGEQHKNSNITCLSSNAWRITCAFKI